METSEILRDIIADIEDPTHQVTEFRADKAVAAANAAMQQLQLIDLSQVKFAELPLIDLSQAKFAELQKYRNTVEVSTEALRVAADDAESLRSAMVNFDKIVAQRLNKKLKALAAKASK